MENIRIRLNHINYILDDNCQICESHSRALLEDKNLPNNVRNLAIRNLEKHLNSKNPNIKAIRKKEIDFLDWMIKKERI